MIASGSWRLLSRSRRPEPTGLSRSDGKRPDGLSHWQNGKALCWDVTVICPLADSYISAAARDAGAATELAASRKELKYAGLDGRYVFSHCLRELGNTKRFSSPAPFLPWPKID